MIRKVLSLILFTAVVTSGRLLVDEGITDRTTTSTASSVTKAIVNDIHICTELKPDYLSTRSGRYQTLDCVAKLCDGSGNSIDGTDIDPLVQFNQPLFDWNCQLGHIVTTNGTCDYDRRYCWDSIDIDVRYFSHRMRDNGFKDIQLSCSVSDLFKYDSEGGLRFASEVDFSYLRRFRGKPLDESCDNDGQCGDNMFCLNSGSGRGTVCQCSVDFMTGVPYVQVLDENYNEWICAPPLMLNQSCSYDRQCQAMDSNSVCVRSEDTVYWNGNGKCDCPEDMVNIKSSCQPIPDSDEVTEKPAIIWWIFTNDFSSKDESSTNRFWWLRIASYIMALLAIFLPLLLIIIAMSILCYRRIQARRIPMNQMPVRPKFPAPKVIINDLLSTKQKSDDKYNLVHNDHLNNQ